MSDGRWKPGQSGNPNGRPPGSGEVAKLRGDIAERVPDILAALIGQAVAGDTAAARLLLERVLPPLRPVEMTVEVPLGEGGLTQQARQMLAAVATGQISTEQASCVISALAAVAKISESDELLKRIEALEQRSAGRGDM